MLTPQKAAARAGVSRRTIMLAIEKKDLQATRDNRNRWQISPEDLDAWMADRAPAMKPVPVVTSETSSDTNHTELRISISKLEAELDAARNQIEDLRSDRDAWREQAQALASRPTRFWPWSRRRP